jgi:hypothetical protein
MIEKHGVDAICRGEGDIYFPELIDRMEQGRDFYDVPNFWFKKADGGIVRNEMGLLLDDLDTLPFPDRDLMYNADLALRDRGFKLFMAMRGCPYRCTYCFNHVLNGLTHGKGKMLRYRSVDNIIAEIKAVKENYFVDSIQIDDDTFLIKPKGWLEEFAEKFPKEIGLPLICNVRANLVDERMGRLLKRMNCRTICMGVECGNQDIARTILKRNISNEQIVNACGILQIDLQTLDFNIRIKPDFGWSSILYPYPGTELGNLAIQKGLFDEDFEKIVVSNKTDSALSFGDKKLERKIVNLHKLFGIIIQFPFLRPLTLFLISLPLKRFYTWLFFALYGYKILQLFSKGRFFRAMKCYIPFYFKYVARLEKRRQLHEYHES